MEWASNPVTRVLIGEGEARTHGKTTEAEAGAKSLRAEEERRGELPSESQEKTALPIPCFQTVASRAGKEKFSVVLRHQICGNLVCPRK